MKIYKAAPKAIRTARIFTGAAALIILLILEFLFLGKISAPAMAGLVLLLAVTTVFIRNYYLVKYFEIYRIEITDNTVIKRCGFFFIKENTVPLDAIQYTTAVSSEFLTKIGLKGFNVVIIYAYGGTLFIPFLSTEEAAEIKHAINQYIRNRKVGEQDVQRTLD